MLNPDAVTMWAGPPPARRQREDTHLSRINRLDAEAARMLAAVDHLDPSEILERLATYVDRYRALEDVFTAREYYRAHEWVAAVLEALPGRESGRNDRDGDEPQPRPGQAGAPGAHVTELPLPERRPWARRHTVADGRYGARQRAEADDRGSQQAPGRRAV